MYPWKLNDLRIPTVKKCVYFCFSQLFPNRSDYKNLFLAFVPLNETLGEMLFERMRVWGHMSTVR